MADELRTPKMTPEVLQRYRQLVDDHSACVKRHTADGRSLEDAHALCSHIERELGRLAQGSMDFRPDDCR
jgi:hypothetical protein